MSFTPEELKHDDHGVPILKFARIEEIASELLQKRSPQTLVGGCRTPVMDILEALKVHTGLSYVFQDLGVVAGKKILGRVNFGTRTLYLDLTLTAEREVQFRFTAAHEIGHWVLHRYRPLRFDGEPIKEFVDDEEALGNSHSKSPREWLEQQANVFAGALVLPSATFKHELVKAQRQIGITRNLGTVFLNSHPSSDNDFKSILSILSDRYGVSKESVRVRLCTQQLIVGEEK